MCGFTIPAPMIPIWWKWFYWINPLAYAVNAMLSSQNYCVGSECSVLVVTNQATGKSQVMTVWDNLSSTYELSYEHIWLWVGVLIFAIFLVRAVTAYGLTFVCYVKR
eukprot:RCo045890